MQLNWTRVDKQAVINIAVANLKELNASIENANTSHLLQNVINNTTVSTDFVYHYYNNIYFKFNIQTTAVQSPQLISHLIVIYSLMSEMRLRLGESYPNCNQGYSSLVTCLLPTEHSEVRNHILNNCSQC